MKVAIDNSVLAVATEWSRQVMVYYLDVSTTAPVFTLTDPVNVNPGFGFSMDLDAGRLAVSSRNDEAYVYDLNSSTPFLPMTLSTPSVSPSGTFGETVAVDGNWLVVGDPNQSRNGSNSGRFTGAAFAYDLSASDPTIPAVALIDPDAGGQSSSRKFGEFLSIDGSFVGVNGGGSFLLYDLDSEQPGEFKWVFRPEFIRHSNIEGDQMAMVRPGEKILIYQTDPTELIVDNQSFTAAEDDDGAVSFGTVVATSPAAPTFQITSGNDSGVFSIDVVTGALFSNGMLDHDTDPAYDLDITASNALGQMTTATIHIDVVNVAPVLTRSLDEVVLYESGIAENTGQVDDPGGGTVSLNASVGTVTLLGDGMWSWSFLTTSTLDSQSVQIDATDAGGQVTSVTFDLTVEKTPSIAFVGARRDGQIELFRSSGTAADTTLLKNIGGRQSSNPHELTVVGDSLYFAATGADGEVELFRTKPNGTTARVKDLAGSISSDPHELIEHDGQLFFVATGPDNETELYKTDGTNVGTVRVKNLSGNTSSNPSNLVVMDGLLYFAASSNTGQRELYRSDGTGPGTFRVTNLYGEGTSSEPELLTVVGDTLYFSATTPDGDRELHSSDGTTARLVADLSGENSSEPRLLTSFAGNLVFVATTEDGQSELFLSNGTEDGTTLIDDLYGVTSSNPRDLVTFEDRLYFVATSSDGQSELHVTDGVTGSTTQLINLHGGTDASIQSLTVAGNLMYFSAIGNDGERELYSSDGTIEQTGRLKDIGGAASSSPREFKAVGNRLYFTATLANGESELFVSDGTSGGTSLVKNLSGSPNPHEIVPFQLESDLPETTNGGSGSHSSHFHAEPIYFDLDSLDSPQSIRPANRASLIDNFFSRHDQEEESNDSAAIDTYPQVYWLI